MPSKPNYNFQRAERDRAKKALKETKLQERKAQAALRKAGETGEAGQMGEAGPTEDRVEDAAGEPSAEPQA